MRGSGNGKCHSRSFADRNLPHRFSSVQAGCGGLHASYQCCHFVRPALCCGKKRMIVPLPSPQHVCGKCGWRICRRSTRSASGRSETKAFPNHAQCPHHQQMPYNHDQKPVPAGMFLQYQTAVCLAFSLYETK